MRYASTVFLSIARSLQACASPLLSVYGNLFSSGEQMHDCIWLPGSSQVLPAVPMAQHLGNWVFLWSFVPVWICPSFLEKEWPPSRPEETHSICRCVSPKVPFACKERWAPAQQLEASVPPSLPNPRGIYSRQGPNCRHPPPHQAPAVSIWEVAKWVTYVGLSETRALKIALMVPGISVRTTLPLATGSFHRLISVHTHPYLPRPMPPSARRSAFTSSRNPSPHPGFPMWSIKWPHSKTLYIHPFLPSLQFLAMHAFVRLCPPIRL